MSSTSDDVEPGGQRDEIERLRAEVARLRALVGPDEAGYAQLRVDLLAARDEVIGAEHEVGVVRGYNQALESEVARLRRDFDWFRDKILGRAKRARSALRRVSSVTAGR